jgi:hypothetical protein
MRIIVASNWPRLRGHERQKEKPASRRFTREEGAGSLRGQHGGEQIAVLVERLTLQRIAMCLEQQRTTAVSSVSPAALSKKDAARFLGIDEVTVEHMIRTRKLASVQHGSQRVRVILVESLRTLLKENQQATGKELMGKCRQA